MTEHKRGIDLPHRIWVDRDEETNEKRWYSIKGMGVEYVRADAAPSLSAVAPQAGDNAEEPEAWIIRCKGWGEELRFTEDGAKELADRLEKICGKTASITPLYTHPCTSTPVEYQNAPDLEDKGGDGWQPIETAPKDRPILLDFSYYYDADRTPTIIYAVGEYVESDNDYVWDSGDEVHHKDAPRAWMDIPKTNIQREPGFDGKRLKIRRPSR